MASLMTLTRSVSLKSQLFNFLPCCTRPLANATCSFSTITPTANGHNPESESETASELFSDDGEIAAGLANPFVEKGPDSPCELKVEKDAMYARVDLPGVCKEALKVWVKNDSIYVKGVEVKKIKLYSKEEPNRKYSLNIDLPRNEYKVEDIRAVMECGVLRILVPKVKPDESDEGAFIVNVE